MNKRLCWDANNIILRVFGSSDAVQVEFAKGSLETAGLHPFIFSRKASPISIGGLDYTLEKPKQAIIHAVTIKSISTSCAA
ncbi:MAG: hypothetical protein V1799_20545 [bacterium]